MNKDEPTMRIGLLSWGLGAAGLVAVLGLGFARHPFHDDDDAKPSVKAAATPGEVRLDAQGLGLAGIQTGRPVQRAGKLLLPASTLLYLGGRAYVYVAVAPGDFVRRPVTGLRFTAQGDLGRVVGWERGQALVTQGAQTLLSQEFKPRGTGGGDGDDD